MQITHAPQGEDIKTTITILSSEPRYKELMDLVCEMEEACQEKTESNETK